MKQIFHDNINPYVQYMYSYPHKTAYRSLKGISLTDYTGVLAEKGHGLYLHVPFCQAKCGYCNLFSVTGQSKEAFDTYLDGVKRQCQQYSQILKPCQTEFSEFIIGGGTPLLLSEAQLSRVFDLIHSYFVMEDNKQAAIETAPNQTEIGKLRILKEAGVTRVSMGIQSFSDTELRALGRNHQAKRAREALELLKYMDFPCINVDFIYGIPGQSVDSLLESLQEALSFEPDEIFLYPLYIKHGSGLVYTKVSPDWQHGYEQYQKASEFLRASGFRQDSMRRFVKGKKKREFSECGFKTSLALGCGGRSYLGNLHFCTPYAITQDTCLKQLEDFEHTEDFLVISHGILLSKEEMRRRYVIRHLLIRPGIPLNQYQNHFGSWVMDDFPILKQWVELGFLRIEPSDEKTDSHGFLTLTELGMGLSDYLGPKLISDNVRERMREWDEIHESFGDLVSGQLKKL